MCTSGANAVGSKIWGKNARRNPETGAMRPQRRMGSGRGCLQTRKGWKRYVLLSCRSLGDARTLFDKSRRARIRNRLRSFNAHAEHKGSKLRWTGNSSKIQEHHITVVTANGEVQTSEEPLVYENDLHIFNCLKTLLPPCRQLSSAERTVALMSGPVVKSHIWPNMERRSTARLRTTCLWWSLDYHRTPARAPPRQRLRRTLHPARSRINEEVAGNCNEEAAGNSSEGIPEWHEDFAENHEIVKFGDLITADHKVLNEGCESRNNHRYSVAQQDFATQWIQSYPWKTKTSH